MNPPLQIYKSSQKPATHECRRNVQNGFCEELKAFVKKRGQEIAPGLDFQLKVLHSGFRASKSVQMLTESEAIKKAK